MIDAKLLEVLVCPVSKGPLKYNRKTDELWCAQSGLAYAIEDDIPIMLSDEARELTAQERKSLAECWRHADER